MLPVRRLPLPPVPSALRTHGTLMPREGSIRPRVCDVSLGPLEHHTLDADRHDRQVKRTLHVCAG